MAANHKRMGLFIATSYSLVIDVHEEHVLPVIEFGDDFSSHIQIPFAQEIQFMVLKRMTEMD
jgi:hypothetical protein